MGMSPEELMQKLKASKQLIKETENVRSVNGQIVVDKTKPKTSKLKKQVIDEDFDSTPFRVDKGNDDEYMPEIPYKTANYKPKTDGVSSNTKLTEQQRLKNLEKLPESIRKAMVETPIPQITNVSIFDESLINEIAHSGEEHLINEVEEEIITTKNIKPKAQKNIKEDLDYSKIMTIIEEVVDRKIKEYYDSKLVSENVQIKVGSTIFSGNLKPLPKKVK